MLNSILLVAAMLLHGPSMPVTHTTVKPIEISASVRTVQMTLNYDLEKILLEEYAAPYWNLTFEKAWEYYGDRRIRIDEITPNVFYKLHFDGGLLEVVLEGAGI